MRNLANAIQDINSYKSLQQLKLQNEADLFLLIAMRKDGEGTTFDSLDIGYAFGSKFQTEESYKGVAWTKVQQYIEDVRSIFKTSETSRQSNG